MKLLKPHRSQLKVWEKLNQAKYRRQEGLFLAEGHKVVRELLNSNWETREILAIEKKSAPRDTILSTIPEGINVYGLSEREWDALSQDKGPEGIMAVVATPPRTNVIELLKHTTGHIVLLYEINNPNNLGAVLRTSHWFGLQTIILSSGSVDFTNPKVVRSAMGSLFHLTIMPDVNFAEMIPAIKEHYFLIGSHTREGTLPHVCTQKTALLLGSESHGLPESLLCLTDERWYISGEGRADSLSLPQAAAIMMYECTKQGSRMRDEG